MIKRVFWIALYTGMGQVLSLITISYVLRNLGKVVNGYMGIIDSTILVMATVISFGIQLSVNRNVATTKSWRSNYILAQSSRFSLSLLIIFFGIVSYFYNWDITKWIYFIAPVIALNGDYSLYGHGKPITAARLSFVRVALPNIAILVGSNFIGEDAIYLYVIFAGIGILNSGLWASKVNDVPYFVKPRKSFYKTYFKYGKVGVFQLSYAIMVTGILAISKGLYSVAILGLVFGILKYFEVFKGVLRIVVQAFFRELKNEGTNLRIDKAGILIGCAILIPTFFYRETTLNFLYNDAYAGIEEIFGIIGLAMFFASLKASADMQILMKRKDDVNLYSYLVALTITLGISFYYSTTDSPVFGIPLGLMAGEFTLVLLLGYQLGKWQFFIDRFIFLAKLIPILLLAVAIRYIFGESIITLFVSLGVYALLSFFFYRKLLFDSSFIIREND